MARIKVGDLVTVPWGAVGKVLSIGTPNTVSIVVTFASGKRSVFHEDTLKVVK